MQRPKGVLLDVDGTLVDSNDAHAQAWAQALFEFGFDVPFANVRRLIGKGGDKLLPEVTGLSAEASQGKAISRRRKEIFLKDFLPGLRPFPRVRELLGRMQEDGLRLAIASSAKGDELEGLLKICGAGEFVEARTSSDDADNSKPDPDIIHAALGKLGQSADEVILLGDTPYDVVAGVQASVTVVAVRSGGWRDEGLAGAAAVYDDVADIFSHYAESPFRGGPMNCAKCGKPMVNKSGWRCENKRCPQAHQAELCKKCNQPPVELVRIVANAGVFRCPNGHEMDCLVE